METRSQNQVKEKYRSFPKKNPEDELVRSFDDMRYKHDEY